MIRLDTGKLGKDRSSIDTNFVSNGCALVSSYTPFFNLSTHFAYADKKSRKRPWMILDRNIFADFIYIWYGSFCELWNVLELDNARAIVQVDPGI